MLRNSFFLPAYTGPKGENTGDSQDEDTVEEEEEVGRVNDGDDDEMEDEPPTVGLTGGMEEHWEVSHNKRSQIFTS